MITIRVTRAHPPGWSRGCTITVRPPDVRGSAEVGSGTRARWPAPVDRVRPALPCGRAAVRRLRVEHGSGADEGACPALADGGHGVAHGLAADVRRRGLRVGRC